MGRSYRPQYRPYGQLMSRKTPGLPGVFCLPTYAVRSCKRSLITACDGVWLKDRMKCCRPYRLLHLSCRLRCGSGQ